MQPTQTPLESLEGSLEGPWLERNLLSPALMHMRSLGRMQVGPIQQINTSAQGSGGFTIPGGFHEKSGCHTE